MFEQTDSVYNRVRSHKTSQILQNLKFTLTVQTSLKTSFCYRVCLTEFDTLI